MPTRTSEPGSAWRFRGLRGSAGSAGSGGSAGFVRPARAADAASLARVQVASWRCGFAGIVPPPLLAELTSDEAEQAFRDRWREAITNPPTSRHRVLAAVTGGPAREVAGFVSAGPATDADRWPGTDGEVYELRVSPERTGQGHASRLTSRGGGDAHRGRLPYRVHLGA